MAKLSRRQKETVIVFNDLDSKATIFTYNRKWQDRLNKYGIKPTETNAQGGVTFELPKKSIRMPVIRKARVLTVEQKKIIRERLVAGRKAKVVYHQKPAKRAVVMENKKAEIRPEKVKSCKSKKVKTVEVEKPVEV